MIFRLYSIFIFIFFHPLNRKRKLNALFGFLKCHIGIKIMGGGLVVDWVNRAKFIIRRGDSGLNRNLYCGLTEYEDMAFMLHYLRDSDDFYDIGANVGAYTILASAVRGCKSYAFEPLPDTFGRLVDQIKINRIDDLVTARNAGVGAETGELYFTNNLNTSNRVAVDAADESVTKVKVINLDGEFTPQSPSFIKIDVEGYESFVLDGGVSFFSSSYAQALIIELNGSGQRFGVADADIDKRIRAFGFRPVRYDPMSRELLGLDKIEFGENIIYVKDILGASERCKSSEKFVLHTANDIII